MKISNNLKNITYNVSDMLLLPIIMIVDKFINNLIFIVILFISFICIIQKFKIISFILIDFNKFLQSFSYDDILTLLKFFIAFYLLKLIKLIMHNYVIIYKHKRLM